MEEWNDCIVMELSHRTEREREREREKERAIEEMRLRGSQAEGDKENEARL
jgi:hypothetical protein